MSQNLRSSSKKPEAKPRDIGKETMDLISVIDPNSLSTMSPAKKNPYASPQGSKDRYNSSAHTKQFSAHNDKPANADYNPA